MGIYDRDWYRERVDRIERRRSARWSPWFVGAVVGLLVFVGLRGLMDVRRDPPFPPTGQTHWFTDPGAQTMAPLTIVAPADSSTRYVVHLDDWATQRPVVMIPVRGSETARVAVPLGRYRVTLTKGLGWRGPGKLFRFNLSAKEAAEPLEFYTVDRRTVGHTIQLETISGNMLTQPAQRR
jgi:hypothetical protein